MKAHLTSNGTAPGQSIEFNCPGCGGFHTIIVDAPNSWTWNGNIDSPTFSPSVLVRWTHVERGVQRCHSFVRDGRIEYLSDCTHALAGQTVDIPEWHGYPWDEPSGDSLP